MTSLQDISAAISLRNLAEASASLQKLVKNKKKHHDQFQWGVALRLAASLGDQDLALFAARKWLAEAPADPARIVAFAEALGAVAKHREAAQAVKTLRTNPAAAADGFYLEGVFLARLGRREDALALFRRALQQNSTHTGAWEQISILDGFDEQDADHAMMMALASRPMTPALATPLCYAIARSFDRAGDIGQAFQWYAQGGALREKAAPFAMAPYAAYLGRLAASFTPQWIETHQSSAEGADLCILIGAPRSGTTLIEQILTTAGSITATGEHTLFRLATLPLGSMEPVDLERARDFVHKDWRQMAQRYQSGLRKRFGPGAVYTDKSMLNVDFAGMIRTLFPKAKFIWCERDPRDVAWSCFRSRITANHWAQQLDNCAQYMQANRKLCSHWTNVFGDSLLRLSYEDLIQSPEETVAALFQHVGVSQPDTWSDFYKSENPVATASLAQVRKPLNANSVGAWRRYEKYLAPVYDKYFQ